MSLDVIFSTSFDEKNPPTNVLSTNKSSFWSTTGVYPQELDLAFSTAKSISEMTIIGYNLKKIIIESCENDSAVKYITQCELSDIPLKENKLQEINCSFSNKSVNKLIKLTVLDGYGDFSIINAISFK